VTDAVVVVVGLIRVATRMSLGGVVEAPAVDVVNFGGDVDERCSRVAGAAADVEVVEVPVEGDEDDAGRDKESSVWIFPYSTTKHNHWHQKRRDTPSSLPTAPQQFP
jgi:hypothetical protein